MTKDKQEPIIDRDEIMLDSIDNKRVRKIRKWISRIFFILIFVMIIVVFPVFMYKKEVNNNFLSPKYQKGVYHMHSTFSDGSGNLDQISKAAKRYDYDFMILTDHGRPNFPSSNATGWKNGVLIVGGSEFSLNAGHLACAGYTFQDDPDYIFPLEAQAAIDDVNLNQGISFISHPLDDKIPWTNNDIHGFTGVEILNGYSSARKTSILNILKFPLQYLFNKRCALMNTLNYPKENLALWDEFNKKGDYYGIYALDVHARLPITKNFQFEWPSYRAMFELFTLYVKTNSMFSTNPETSAATIVSAMRQGRFFSAIEGIASANGFDLHFQDRSGKLYEQGSRIAVTNGDIVLNMPFAFDTQIKMMRNGELFKSIENKQQQKIRIPIRTAGTYRLEIFVPGNKFDHLPWILTNPFFLGKKKPLTKFPVIHSIKKPLSIGDKAFNVEKNSASRGDMRLETIDGTQVLRMDYHLKKQREKKDFWVALARREAINFKGYSGLTITVRSKRVARFWLELRTKRDGKEIAYSHSFPARSEWKTVSIPFSRFHSKSKKAGSINLARIESLFITINNLLTVSNKAGYLQIKEFGLF